MMRLLRRLHGPSEIFFGINQNNWSFLFVVFSSNYQNKRRTNYCRPGPFLLRGRGPTSQAGAGRVGVVGAGRGGAFEPVLGNLLVLLESVLPVLLVLLESVWRNLLVLLESVWRSHLEQGSSSGIF